MDMSNRIHTLLIAQNQEWTSSVFNHLWRTGFAPIMVAQTPSSALQLLEQVSPRLALIDLQLPDCNVIDLCRAMLAVQPQMKIVLMAEANSTLPPTALEAGVVGCLYRDLPIAAWPGLLAYIDKGGMAFRRSFIEDLLAQGENGQNGCALVKIGQLHIDFQQQLVLYDGLRIQLTPREFSLLTCLVRRRDQIVTFDEILADAWGYDPDLGDAAQVRLYVARLRNKLREGTARPNFIITQRGIGYRLQTGILSQANGSPHSQPTHEILSEKALLAGSLPWNGTKPSLYISKLTIANLGQFPMQIRSWLYEWQLHLRHVEEEMILSLREVAALAEWVGLFDVVIACPPLFF